MKNCSDLLAWTVNTEHQCKTIDFDQNSSHFKFLQKIATTKRTTQIYFRHFAAVAAAHSRIIRATKENERNPKPYSAIFGKMSKIGG